MKPGERGRISRAFLVVVGAAVLGGGLLALTAETARGGKNKDRRVIKLKKKKVFGKRPSEWTEEWWQWYMSIPQSVHPLNLDETGELCEIGQRGPVWFIGGASGDSTVIVRSVTIPTETALLFPILNVVNDNVGVDPPQTEEQIRQGAADYVKLIDLGTLFCSLDTGEGPVPIRDLDKNRIPSGAFRYWCPEDSVYAAWGLTDTRGIYWPAVSDGYWVMLAPLPPGQHTLHFGGTVGPPVNFSLDITYHLTVVESNKP